MCVVCLCDFGWRVSVFVCVRLSVHTVYTAVPSMACIGIFAKFVCILSICLTEYLCVHSVRCQTPTCVWNFNRIWHDSIWHGTLFEFLHTSTLEVASGTQQLQLLCLTMNARTRMFLMFFVLCGYKAAYSYSPDSKCRQMAVSCFHVLSRSSTVYCTPS